MAKTTIDSQNRREVTLPIISSQAVGRIGRDKSISQIKRRLSKPGLSDAVKRGCIKYGNCACGKSGPGKGKAPLQPTIQQVSRSLVRISTRSRMLHSLRSFKVFGFGRKVRLKETSFAVPPNTQTLSM